MKIDKKSILIIFSIKNSIMGCCTSKEKIIPIKHLDSIAVIKIRRDESIDETEKTLTMRTEIISPKAVRSSRFS